MSIARLIGIHIEGIAGEDASSAGLVWYYGRHTPPAGVGYEWVPGLAQLPPGAPTSYDPVTGKWKTSAYTFRLNASDPIATRLLRTQVGSDVVVASQMSALTTTLPTAGSGSFGVGPVFVGDETMRITSGSLGTYTVERGAYGSTAQEHDAGVIITQHPAWWVPRAVTMLELDVETGVERAVWRGYLDRIETSADGTQIVLKCSEHLARQAQATTNREPLDLNAERNARVSRGRLDGGLVRSGSTWRVGAGRVAVQVGNAVVRCAQNSQGVILLLAQQSECLLGSVLGLGDEAAAYLEPCWELLVWDRLGDEAAPGLEVSPLQGQTYQFHPLYIARCLLDGTLGAHWALDSTAVDWSSFNEAINATPDLRIDRLILGWGGAAIKPFEEAERLMRLFGFSAGLSEDGTYRVVRSSLLDLATVASAVEVSAYRDGPLQVLPPLSQGVSSVSAVVGALPWAPGRKVEVVSRGGARRAQLIRERYSVEYTASCLDRGRAQSVARQLASSAGIVHYDLPRVKARVAASSEGASYDLGAWVKIASFGGLQNAWFVAADGSRVANLDGRVDVIGQIIGRRPDPSTGTSELELLLWAYRTNSVVRERAPAALVKAVSGSTITIQHVFTSADGELFVPGDELQIVDRTGARRSVGAAPVVVSVTPTTIEFAGSFGVALVSGDWIRLAPSHEYSNDARYPGYTRPYVVLADSDDEIALPVGGPDEADRYGGGLGVSF